MMWDFSGSTSGGQGSPPYYVQQQQQQQHHHHHHSRGVSPAPPYVRSPGGFDVYSSGPPPAPFMPIGAPGSDHLTVDRYGGDNGPWAVSPASAPTPRSPVAIHVQSHRTSHQSHSHSHSNAHRHHSHSHGRSHSHSQTARPVIIVQHGSNPVQINGHRPQPDPVQLLRPAPSNQHFVYSRCTGKKKALCIGINYRGQQNQLFGCVNDARNVKNFLMRHGYKERHIRLLTDDAQDTRLLPTRANILEAMRWLVKDACPDDSLFFHYSGHGAQVKDRNGDEIDGYDEVIFPLDHKSAGYIVDDLMHSMMVKPLPAGCRLTVINNYQSCHSGSVLDLPYLYSSDGRVKGSQVNSRWFKAKSTPADVISWSGCKDSQTSADTWEQGAATGAMSHAFMSSLKQNPNQTYQELLRSIRVILKKKYSQKPQLSSSHHIDTNLRFII
ncbi:caspase domain-containing protein [Trametes polyzona]|nr:caspase domain-containing protein [Trametes polyzona]